MPECDINSDLLPQTTILKKLITEDTKKRFGYNHSISHQGNCNCGHGNPQQFYLNRFIIHYKNTQFLLKITKEGITVIKICKTDVRTYYDRTVTKKQSHVTTKNELETFCKLLDTAPNNKIVVNLYGETITLLYDQPLEKDLLDCHDIYHDYCGGYINGHQVSDSHLALVCNSHNPCGLRIHAPLSVVTFKDLIKHFDATSHRQPVSLPSSMEIKFKQ